jgi:hypothetical protein
MLAKNAAKGTAAQRALDGSWQANETTTERHAAGSCMMENSFPSDVLVLGQRELLLHLSHPAYPEQHALNALIALDNV